MSIIHQVKKLKDEFDKSQVASTKVVDLQAVVDKAKYEAALAKAERDNAVADKDKALSNLEDKGTNLETKRSLKEIAKSTIEKWRPNYNLTVNNMNALFECITPHLEACYFFRDVVQPFWV